MSAFFVDTHTHLSAPDFDLDRAEVVSRAVASGIRYLITIGSGYGPSSATQAVHCAHLFPNVYAAVGLHPNDASADFKPSTLEELARDSKVVAIGETGLDFYRDHAARDLQEKWFRAQVELALGLRKPLVVHCRKAEAECLRILEELGAGAIGGVFHCYSEDEAFAAKLFSINFLVSIPGSITFKKADRFRRIVAALPLEQIMLETDAPFLAPEPHRGKRCESGFMVETAKKVADIKKVSLEELALTTTANAIKLFNLPVPFNYSKQHEK